MNAEEIEQLKQARDEALSLLEEVIRPHGIYDTAVAKSGGAAMAEIYMETGDKIKAAIEALRPKPERLRLWVVKYPSGSLTFCRDPNDAKQKQHPGGRIVPMIEARPLPELPEMEEWEVDHCDDGSRGIKSNGNYWSVDTWGAKSIADAHNATVRAFKKWAEDVKKEAGDE